MEEWLYNDPDSNNNSTNIAIFGSNHSCPSDIGKNNDLKTHYLPFFYLSKDFKSMIFTSNQYIMLRPIQRDHELICPCGCGCVLQNVEESIHDQQEKQTIPPSLNVFLLGSALDNNVKYHFNRDRNQIHQENVLRKLLDITKEYVLPDRFAYATFNQLKRNKKGFWSEKEPIKQLLLILSKDENYIYFPKMRAIKARYESVNGI